ncbi:MAG: SGNH/GDSL hydrolase family protein, partial [Bacteroidota bacterium]
SEASDSALTRYFSTIRSDLGDDKGVLITITSALNDRNETAASVKSGITPGDSPSAYKDNLESLIERIEEIWTLNNWSLTELIFLLTISHPVSVPADEEMSSYAQIAKQYASNSSRLAVIDAQELDQSEFESNDWYVSSADKNHLSEAGYKGFTVKLVDLILAS